MIQTLTYETYFPRHAFILVVLLSLLESDATQQQLHKEDTLEQFDKILNDRNLNDTSLTDLLYVINSIASAYLHVVLEHCEGAPFIASLLQDSLPHCPPDLARVPYWKYRLATDENHEQAMKAMVKDDYVTRTLQECCVTVIDPSMSMPPTHERVNKSDRPEEKSTSSWLRLCCLWCC